jgi:flagellar basal body-associated protein FliL
MGMEKGKLMMVIIIALLVILLGAVVGVSIYVMNLINSQTTIADVVNAQSQIATSLSIDEKASMSLGDAIVTNLATGADGRKHFISVNGYIAYDIRDKKASDTFATKLTNNIHIARSIALACIISSTYEDLRDPDGMSILADRITRRLQEEFETNLIVDVYLSDFLLQ